MYQILQPIPKSLASPVIASATTTTATSEVLSPGSVNPLVADEPPPPLTADTLLAALSQGGGDGDHFRGCNHGYHSCCFHVLGNSVFSLKKSPISTTKQMQKKISSHRLLTSDEIVNRKRLKQKEKIRKEQEKENALKLLNQPKPTQTNNMLTNQCVVC